MYAEDPMNNFLPDIGTLNTYVRPEGMGIRVDDGFEEGMEIPIYYDPMISKLITHGKDREEARERMIRAIDDYTISGVETTLPFCKFALKHEAFISGAFDTHFVSKHFSAEKLQNSDPAGEEIAALFTAKLYEEGAANKTVVNSSENTISKWKINRR